MWIMEHVVIIYVQLNCTRTVYGIYHTRMAQIFHRTCMEYTVRVWYAPYAYGTIYTCSTEQSFCFVFTSHYIALFLKNSARSTSTSNPLTMEIDK